MQPTTTMATTGGSGSERTPFTKAPASNINSNDNINSNGINAAIAKRRMKMDERKRELLLEARRAKIDWIYDDDDDANNISSSSSSSIVNGNNNNNDDNQHHHPLPSVGGGGNDNNNNNAANLLKELRACSTDVLPCAPEVIRSMLYPSVNCDWTVRPARRRRAAANNDNDDDKLLRESLERRGLPWESVRSDEKISSPPPRDGTADDEKCEFIGYYFIDFSNGLRCACVVRTPGRDFRARIVGTVCGLVRVAGCSRGIFPLFACFILSLL